MSTDYSIAKQGEHEVSVLEHSSQLDLYVDTDETGLVRVLRNLYPAELAEIGKKLIQVAAYQDSSLDCYVLAIEGVKSD